MPPCPPVSTPARHARSPGAALPMPVRRGRSDRLVHDPQRPDAIAVRCPACGCRFLPGRGHRRDAVFCRSACRQAAHRARQGWQAPTRRRYAELASTQCHRLADQHRRPRRVGDGLSGGWSRSRPWPRAVRVGGRLRPCTCGAGWSDARTGRPNRPCRATGDARCARRPGTGSAARAAPARRERPTARSPAPVAVSPLRRCIAVSWGRSSTTSGARKWFHRLFERNRPTTGSSRRTPALHNTTWTVDRAVLSGVRSRFRARPACKLPKAAATQAIHRKGLGSSDGWRGSGCCALATAMTTRATATSHPRVRPSIKTASTAPPAPSNNLSPGP